jgi:hypothetical protein
MAGMCRGDTLESLDAYRPGLLISCCCLLNPGSLLRRQPSKAKLAKRSPRCLWMSPAAMQGAQAARRGTVSYQAVVSSNQLASPLQEIAKGFPRIASENPPRGAQPLRRCHGERISSRDAAAWRPRPPLSDCVLNPKISSHPRRTPGSRLEPFPSSPHPYHRQHRSGLQRKPSRTARVSRHNLVIPAAVPLAAFLGPFSLARPFLSWLRVCRSRLLSPRRRRLLDHRLLVFSSQVDGPG